MGISQKPKKELSYYPSILLLDIYSKKMKKQSRDGIKTIETGGIKVYNLTAGRTLPQWLTSQKRKELRKDPDFQRRIQLIQDTEFPNNSQCVKFSPDEQFMGATGMYPPRIRMFELEQHSQKFERYLDAEVVKFEFLDVDHRYNLTLILFCAR